jgi:hypothetical protein
MLEKLKNKVVTHCHPLIQILFMERVVKSVAASWPQEGNQILLSEKEGGVRAGRRHKVPNPIRTPWLDLLAVQATHQSPIEIAELQRRYGRTRDASGSWRYSHVGQRGSGARPL